MLAPLPYTWLALLGLAVLWVNGLLIAGAAWQQRGRLRAVGDSLRAARAAGRWIEGVIEEGHGDRGALAVRRVEQRGRAMTTRGPRRILFTDRATSGECFGGRVAGRPIAAGLPCELWLEDGAAVTRDEIEFSHAARRAATARGLECRAESTVGAGERVVVVLGETVRIARMDPLALVGRKRALLAAFAVATLASCGAVTALACSGPRFGPASTAGAIVGLLWFLLIQPLGTWARDAARLPPDRPVGGLWRAPSS